MVVITGILLGREVVQWAHAIRMHGLFDWEIGSIVIRKRCIAVKKNALTVRKNALMVKKGRWCS